MSRYTAETKADALKSIQENGIAKTKEAMGISQQTLYKWKSENKLTTPSRRGRRKGSKIAAKPTDSIRALLKDDAGANQRIQSLLAENNALRELNAKLKKALHSLLDE